MNNSNANFNCNSSIDGLSSNDDIASAFASKLEQLLNSSSDPSIYDRLSAEFDSMIVSSDLASVCVSPAIVSEALAMTATGVHSQQTYFPEVSVTSIRQSRANPATSDIQFPTPQTTDLILIPILGSPLDLMNNTCGRTATVKPYTVPESGRLLQLVGRDIPVWSSSS